MKSIGITFFVLVIAFLVSWTAKTHIGIERPDNLTAEAYIPWYMGDYSSPTVEDEWQIDPTIPDNYVPVPGESELYMIVDTSGVITGYKHRYKNEEDVWVWEDVNPDIPDNYELVEGSKDLYKITASDGSVSYCKYVRNEDNTYAFVPCDEFGTPYYDGEDAEVIASNFVHEDGNIYTVYNSNGVKEGYAKRVENKDGTHTWKNSDGTNDAKKAEVPTVNQQQVTTEDNNIVIDPDAHSGENKQNNADGTYTVSNTSTNTVTENGETVIYQTTIINTYDADGNLLFTQEDGPKEISRTAVTASQTPDKSLIKDTLDGEYERVSSLVSYNTSLANDVLAKLNAERENQGLSALSMSKKSEAYKLACIRAGDMAYYNNAASESPMYGTLDDMVSKWGCTSANPSENIWKAGNKSADDIHSRLQAYDGSRNVRMSADYTEVGIAIVSKDDQLYIAEVYLK